MKLALVSRGIGEASRQGWWAWSAPGTQPRPSGPSTRAPSPESSPSGGPLLVSLCLAGESGVQECSGQRPSPYAVSTQRVTDSYLAPVYASSVSAP